MNFNHDIRNTILLNDGRFLLHLVNRYSDTSNVVVWYEISARPIRDFWMVTVVTVINNTTIA